MAERCDGIPWGIYTQYSYKKVAPNADGLNAGYDPVVFFEQLIALKLIPYSNILRVVVEYDGIINYPCEALFGFYQTESNILAF